ncbi:glycosyltransferase [Parapedobacter sp. DT-150]|uniref:glycosyltransferase n=1 Tax=Parapedobacter sp. DT-150 TaxID=3396162 RepID=UPI003F1C791F
MEALWLVIQILVGCYYVAPILMFLAFKLRSKASEPDRPSTKKEYDYALIVTAYEETKLISAVVDSLLQLNYHNYMIYIVADKCDVTDLQFGDQHVVVLRPETTLANNVASHFYAINRYRRPHDVLAIIDSDNLVHPEFLNECNRLFDKGYSAVQGLRAAKRTDTLYASLDAARDNYYHFYDGEVLFGLGSSATLAGSGMAFTTARYVDCMSAVTSRGAGFDKLLQAQLVLKGYRIAFNRHAIVYDEKTAHSDQLVNQRARWINSWFKYVGLGFEVFWMGLRKGSLNQLLFGFILLRPPLFMFLSVGALFMVAGFALHPAYGIGWLFAFVMFTLGFIVALLHSNADKKIYRSLLRAPIFMYYQFIALFFSPNANKRSVATKHNKEEFNN